ncbi:MAG: double-strand break repair protein AddB, partial [Pseudomonadota bacterium]
DYKTGALPNTAQVKALHRPQMPLEAAIAEAGGFEGLGQRAVSTLVYIRASGRNEGGEQQQASKEAPGVLAGMALEQLEGLIAYYDDPATSYEVKRRAGTAFTSAYRFDEYAQLARLAEWAKEADAS